MSIFKTPTRLLIIFLLFVSVLTHSQNTANEPVHELTIYVMPTLLPLDWSSPSNLYKSMSKCYIKTIGKKDNYLLGHVAVSLNTPLLAKPLLIAQTSKSVSEKVNLILKKKIGFGIMGAALQGRLETEEELNHKLNVYAKRNKLAFIRYRINERAARRMIDFITRYSTKMNDQNAPCDFYGGAFWPRYYNEGSGCSAFGIALLDVANLMTPVVNQWKIDVNIPMNLVGGEFNNGIKVKKSTIRKTKTWYKEQGRANIDFVEYSIYEPSVMFDWILNKRNEHDSIFHSFNDREIPGLLVEASRVSVNEDIPLFVKRPETNVFIERYYEKVNLNVK